MYFVSCVCMHVYYILNIVPNLFLVCVVDLECVPCLHSGCNWARNLTGFPVCFSGKVPPPGEYPTDTVWYPNVDGCPLLPSSSTPQPMQDDCTPPWVPAFVASALVISGK